MADHIREKSVDRSEFLRRTGALGLAGAAALGIPLLETRLAGAAPLRPPADVIAAGGGATIKLGYVDSFSGVYAAAAASQESGVRVAIANAEKKNNRIKYQLVKGDDAAKPAVGVNEAKRLISQEKVDTLMGGLSSAVGLAVSATCSENNVLFVAIGTHDTNITGAKAHRVTFRACPNNSMLASALGPKLLTFGKRWYFMVADYAFGTDAYDRLKRILLAHGGEVSGKDLHPLGATDYSSYMTHARNTNANVMVFCNYGPDTQNSTKEFINQGLNKKMRVGGILSGNEVLIGCPVEDLIGSVWGVDWDGDAGGRSREIYAQLKPVAKGFPPNWRQYLGFITTEQIIDRLNAAGSTDTEKLVEAFEGHKFDAGKAKPAEWRKCDHQNVQQTYAGIVVPKNKRRSPQEFLNITNVVGGEFAAGPCSNPDSHAAEMVITSEKIGPRSDYKVTSLR